MKHLVLALVGLALVQAETQGQVITLLHNGSSSFFYNLDDLNAVVNSAVSGDTIVLPGGAIQLNGSLVVQKKLAFVGAGALDVGTPVTGTTTIVGQNNGGFFEQVLIEATGAGTSFHGVRFGAAVIFSGFGNEAPSFSTSFTRCVFLSALSVGGGGTPVDPPAASNVRIHQCIVLNGITNSGSTAPQGFVAENCIVQGNLNFGSNIASAIVNQCIILDMTTINGANPGVQFSNSIFTRQNTSYNLNSASSYQNNLFVLLSGGSGLNWSGASGTGNEASTAPLSNIFVNVGSYMNYDPAFDYNLSSSVGAGIGLDGHDVGIHDGPSPWKDGGIPFNPHWLGLSPSLGNSSNGVIGINMSGAAQQD